MLEKIKNLKWYFQLIILVAIAGLLFMSERYFVTSDTRDEIIVLNDQISQLQAKNETARVATQRINEFRALYASKASEYEELKVLLPEQREIEDKGATMRLGEYRCHLTTGSLAEKLYGASTIKERHRHRFEFNNDYREEMAKSGLVCSGLSPDYRLVEIVEIPNHPYYIATQFHPEFGSRPNRAHPLFSGLIAAAIKQCGQRLFGAKETNADEEVKNSKTSKSQRGEMNTELAEAE